MLSDNIIRIQLWFFRVIGWVMILLAGVLMGWIIWAHKKKTG